jgi:hypothetical protein
MGHGKAIVLGVIKWKGLLLGAFAFFASHQVIVLKWTAWFAGDARYVPWFLNDGNVAIVFTGGILFAASVLASGLWAEKNDSLVYGVNVAAGAFVTMTVVIFTLKGGPGTLFPIALAMGGWLTFVATFTGALIVWPLKHVSRRR